MDAATGDIIGSNPGPKNAEMNSNSNNIISEQDVNLTFGFNETAKVIKDDEGEVDSPDEDESEQRLEAEKQEWMQRVEEERSQWEALESVQRTSTGRVKSATPLVSFREVLDYFRTKTFDKSNIRPTIERSGFAAFLHFLFGPPKLHRSLVEERDLIFCVAQNQLDDNEEIHGQVLQTIYKKLTGSKFDCPRKGPHWETIGFQGNDPATDLRGVGFLGLMNILYAVTDENVASLFTDFYRLSLDEEQNYPFCVMSFNVTRIALQVLREEKLHKECNKRKQVVAVLNEFYAAVFLHIYTTWKTQFKTMKDSGHVMSDAEKKAKKNPKRLLRNLETTLKQKYAQKKKLPASPVPIAGPLMPDQPLDLHRKLSVSSSQSSESRKKNLSHQSLEESTPNSARFVPTKKSFADDLQDFTDIRLELKDEPVTDL